MLLSDILVRKDNDKCIVVINGQEIDVNKYNIMDLLDKNVDKNAVQELIEIISKLSTDSDSSGPKFSKTITISKSIHRINVNKIISPETKETESFKLNNDYQVNSEAQQPKTNFRPNAEQAIRLEVIDEINKSVIDISIGKTTRKQAYAIIKKLGTKFTNFNNNDLFQSFEDLGISFYFSPTNDTVEEIILSWPFQGVTTKGLKINNTMEQAIQLHGAPRIRSLVIAFWDNFSVFIKDEIVTSIKLR